MRIPLLLILLFACFQLSAQRLENIKAEPVGGGETVIITYDITGAPADQKFKVSVYSSHNNYSTPLSLVSGDVTEVTPGTGKRIVWNARSEMVEFTGDITFELRADPIVQALTVKTPSGVKKGKTATINYTGVNAGDNAKLELIRSGIVVNLIGTTNEPSKYSWHVPIDVDKGSDYQIRLTAGGRVVTSGNFAIKQKIKPIWIIIPAAVVTGVVVFLLVKPKKSSSKNNDLPTPPEPDDE